MKGYMGSPPSTGHIYEDDGGDYEEDNEQEGQNQHVKPSGGFDLIYVLDSIYHFPPAVPHFLTTAIQSLSPGGVIAYTDIIPPPDLPSWLGYWILPTALGVPTRNLVARPKDLAAYKAQLEKIGYVDVRIDDWTGDVWPGFARFLREKGGLWTLVARGAEWGLRNDWKFIAVRAAKKD
jgi:SAM-dependent methyltransferase